MSDLHFEVIGARAEPYAAVPTLMLRLRIRDAAGARIHAIGLRIQIQIEPQRRHYTSSEEDRLFELFAEPARWGETLRGLLWTHASAMIPAFDGSTEIDLPLVCSYDFEVAAAKYFHALDDGEIPLLLLFSGSVFAHGEGGLSVDQVPWHREASFRLPVRVWRDVVDAYWPDSAWIRVRRDTFDALHRFKGREALTGWEETIEALLQRAGADEREPV
jgi:hypothetical protein